MTRHLSTLSVRLLLAISFCAVSGHVWAQGNQIGTIGLTQGWATFGQALPKGAATSGLQVGTFDTQTDVKTRWPDGSIRFAVVTVNATAAASYPLKAAAALTGSFTPPAGDASVTLSIAGDTYVATMPAVASTDPWLAGKLVSEGRYVVAPARTSDGAAHPFLLSLIHI